VAQEKTTSRWVKLEGIVAGICYIWDCIWGPVHLAGDMQLSWAQMSKPRAETNTRSKICSKHRTWVREPRLTFNSKWTGNRGICAQPWPRQRPGGSMHPKTGYCLACSAHYPSTRHSSQFRCSSQVEEHRNVGIHIETIKSRFGVQGGHQETAGNCFQTQSGIQNRWVGTLNSPSHKCDSRAFLWLIAELVSSRTHHFVQPSCFC
jgi:hypothetical protein